MPCPTHLLWLGVTPVSTSVAQADPCAVEGGSQASASWGAVSTPPPPASSLGLAQKPPLSPAATRPCLHGSTLGHSRGWQEQVARPGHTMPPGAREKRRCPQGSLQRSLSAPANGVGIWGPATSSSFPVLCGRVPCARAFRGHGCWPAQQRPVLPRHWGSAVSGLGFAATNRPQPPHPNHHLKVRRGCPLCHLFLSCPPSPSFFLLFF